MFFINDIKDFKANDERENEGKCENFEIIKMDLDQSLHVDQSF